MSKFDELYSTISEMLPLKPQAPNAAAKPQAPVAGQPQQQQPQQQQQPANTNQQQPAIDPAVMKELIAANNEQAVLQALQKLNAPK